VPEAIIAFLESTDYENAIRLAYINPLAKADALEIINIAPSGRSITVHIDKPGKYVLVLPLNIPKKLDVAAFPNPYKPSKHGNKGITFTNLRQGDRIRLYTITGEMIYDAKVSADGNFVWNVQNNSGNKIASGVYVYYIESRGSKIKGKVAVER